MSKARLTERQNEVYEFVRSYLRDRNKPPTLKEIGRGLGIRSTNGVYKLLSALEAKGYIRREKHVARGITLVEDAGDPFAFDVDATRLTVVHRTTGSPEMLRRRSRRSLSVDPRLLHKAHDPEACLIVRAGDDGMNGDGIQKDDFLVVEEYPWQDLAKGRLVACLVHEELRVRRLYFTNGRLHLRPSDRHYTEETFPPGTSDCHVIGPVLALIRGF